MIPNSIRTRLPEMNILPFNFIKRAIKQTSFANFFVSFIEMKLYSDTKAGLKRILLGILHPGGKALSNLYHCICLCSVLISFPPMIRENCAV